MAGGARKGRGGMITEINVTPLVDIMLVLLIIFMLTANLIAKQAIEVDLPKASQGTAPKTPLGITLTQEGGLYLNGEEVTPAQLRTAVAAAVKEDAKATVLIAGDKHTSHGRVVWVLDVVKSLGVTNFAIQIDPASLQPPNPKKAAP